METLKAEAPMKVREGSYRFSLGPLFVVFVTWPWMNTLLASWGYRPYQGWGIALGLALILGFAAAAWLIDWGLARLGLGRGVRSALWLGAVVGPYAGLWAIEQGVQPMAAQALGLAATLGGFVAGYALDRVLQKRNR
jgi:hypothetical protein